MSRQKLNFKTVQLTSSISTSVLRPHPRHSVLNGCIEGICRRWKTWFKHLSPARHTSGWHSYIIDRLMQSDCGPQGSASSGWQLHCGMSSNWARWTSTFPTGTFTYTQSPECLNLEQKTSGLLSCTIPKLHKNLYRRPIKAELNTISFNALIVIDAVSLATAWKSGP